MDEAIGRMPDAPHAHLPLTVRTAQGVPTGALPVALAVGQGGDDLDRPLDDPLHLGQGLLNHLLELGKCLGRLYPVVADPLKSFGKHMLNHAPNKGVDFHRFPLHPLALVGPIMIRDPVSVVEIDPPERDGRTHHILGQIRRQALIPRRDITLLHVRHEPLAIARVTRIDQPIDLLGLHRLSEHRQEMPLLLFPQHGIGQIIQMDPLVAFRFPAAAGGNDIQMGVVFPIAAMGLDDDDVASLDLCATDTAQEIIETPDPTAHEAAQQPTGVLIKYSPVVIW
jgi:hypothetical protein